MRWSKGAHGEKRISLCQSVLILQPLYGINEMVK